MAYGIHSDVAKERFMDRVAMCPMSGCWFWMGSTFNTGYGECWDGSDYKRVTTHRMSYRLFIGPVDNQEFIDHKCGVKGCVNPDHLRKCTKAQNGMNRGKNKNNTSGFKGVFFSKAKNRWVAKIIVGPKRYWLGQFKTPEEAHNAYTIGAVKYHGEFANNGVI